MPPDTTITALAAPRSTLLWTMGVLVVGTLILLPSFLYLFRVFKGNNQSAVHVESADALSSHPDR